MTIIIYAPLSVKLSISDFDRSRMPEANITSNTLLIKLAFSVMDKI